MTKNNKQNLEKDNFYKADSTQSFDADSGKALYWEAPTSFSHGKSALWYAGLIAVVILACAIFYYFTKDILTIVVVLFCFGLIAFYGLREPRTIKYEMDSKNISINGKKYSFSEFRMFHLTRRDKGSSLSLVPVKRFLPAVNVNFYNEKEKEVLGLIGGIMPVQERESDMFDKILQFIGY